MKKTLTLLAIAFCFHINAQIITTIAGGGTLGLGDGWQANSAQLSYPRGITVDGSGNYYIADYGNNRVRKVNASGIITTIAGNGTQGYGGDTGPATNAKLYNPTDVAIDRIGNIYIADAGNFRVRKINTSGVITTIAGYAAGNSGDGGQATTAKLGYPVGITLDSIGNLYIADASNNRIRKVNTLGIITTIAGNGTAAYTGDGGQASSAQLWQPSGVALDVTGNLYIADVGNNVVRMINTLGIISTIAGKDTAGYSGDGGQATTAKLNAPFGVAVDMANNIYIADGNNYCIRMVNTSGIITTVAGNGTAGFNGDGGQATSAELNQQVGVALDAAGNIYIADINNNRVRFVCTAAITVSVNSPPICTGGTTTLTATGATNYSWTPSTGLNMNIGNPVIANPTTSTIYTVTGTTVGCKGAATSTVSVNPLPTITVNTATICAGSTTTLTASGASTYSWNAFTTGATIVLSPTVTTHYTVTATDSNNCTSHSTTTITVHTLPNITVNTSTICAGNTTTLTANGANTYTWSTSDTGATIKPSPAGTIHYTVTGTDINNCTKSKTTTVTVNQLPLISVNSATICAGATATLTASSLSPCTYTWNTNQTSTVITPSPSLTTQYMVTGTDANNCSKSRTTTVTVNQLPVVSVTSNTASLCSGTTATLTASGANTYTWSTNQTSINITITPTVNTTYTVTGTDANDCINIDTITQVVINCATTDVRQTEVNNNEINIYPNPNNGSFIVETSSPKQQTLKIYDVTGKLVLNQSINNKTIIDANNLNAGIYNISILSTTGVINKRMVITK